MPRIFHVTFTREFQCSIVAESKEELTAALESQDHEFDDWADQDGWRYNILDHLAFAKHAVMIPKSFKEPDMGVEEGECVNIYDYQKTHPDYLDRVNAEATEVARKINTEKLTPELFPSSLRGDKIDVK